MKHILIPGILGYAATSDGKIWSLSSNWRGFGVREIIPILNGRGYFKVRFQIGKIRKNFVVHKLIAKTFLPLRPGLNFEIRHKDGNPLNNFANNLCWGTRKDNADDRERHGRTSRGKRHSDAIKNGIAVAKAEKGVTIP